MKRLLLMSGICSALLCLVFVPIGSAADIDPNEWFDECPDNQCGAPPAGGPGGGGGGGGPIVISYDWGPKFSLQEDIDADGMVDTRDNCPFTPNDQSENSDGDDHGDACDNCLNIANNEDRKSVV